MFKPKIVLATHNQGKLGEFKKLLGEQFELVSCAELNIPTPDETGFSYIENALLKARHASLHSGLPAIADDSGLSVDALKGEPGIYSARYAGPAATDALNIEKVLAQLFGTPEELRSARFHCALAYIAHYKDPEPVICEGVWAGRILEAPRGHNGFGYDPIFYAVEQGCASAELSAEMKNQVSHRAKAVEQMVGKLQTLYNPSTAQERT